jgi:hypothetical protein
MTLDSLAVRKALFSRIIAFDEIEPSLRVCDRKTCDAARGLCNELKTKTQSEIASPNNDLPLDQYVHMTTDWFVTALQAHHQLKPDGGTLKESLARIRSRGASISCEQCAGGPAVCDGGDYDDEIVERGGHCIASFRGLFTATQEIARRYHEAAGIKAKWPDCRFKLRFVNAKPHKLGSNIHISGEFDPSKDPGTVNLMVQPMTFDWPAYASVCYVLLHEAFHALAGIEEGTTRNGVSPADPFGEGWVDWMVFRILKEVAGGKGPGAAHSSTLLHPEEQISRAELLHLARFDDFSCDHEDDAEMPARCRTLRAGSDAAERFLDLCERFLESDEEAWKFFLEVSLRLNMRRISMDEHESLVWKVMEHVPYKRELNVPTFADTAANLRKLFRNRDIDAIIEWLTDP